MPTSYNLRSLQRRRGMSVGQCYLQNFLQSESPEIFDPKVRLERLKLLECRDIKNSKFYIEKGRIKMKQCENKTFLLKKKYLLKILFTIILLATSAFYWEDYLQSYGFTLAKKLAEIQPTIQNYYSDALRFHQKILKQFNYKVQKNHNENGKSVSTVPEDFTHTHDFEIRKLVGDYFEELEKKNKIGSKKKSSKSFIEDQCKSITKDKFNPLKNSFYNFTVPELANFNDYALESQGAKIMSVFETELYSKITVKFLYFNLWPELSQFLMKYLERFSPNGPNSVLIPWKKPGDCWAFKGSHGRVQIRLSQKIVIIAITIDHIPKEIAPHGSFQSAPKKFSVLGIEKCESQFCRTYLGSYEYKSDGPPTQTFSIYTQVEIPFEIIEILIQSNHGNNKYTCIYKIRVHGY